MVCVLGLFLGEVWYLWLWTGAGATDGNRMSRKWKGRGVYVSSRAGLGNYSPRGPDWCHTFAPTNTLLPIPDLVDIVRPHTRKGCLWAHMKGSTIPKRNPSLSPSQPNYPRGEIRLPTCPFVRIDLSGQANNHITISIWQNMLPKLSWMDHLSG